MSLRSLISRLIVLAALLPVPFSNAGNGSLIDGLMGGPDDSISKSSKSGQSGDGALFPTP